MNSRPTLILYRASISTSSLVLQEVFNLQPGDDLNLTLGDETDYRLDRSLPEVGDRPPLFRTVGNGTTQARQGDWQIESIDLYPGSHQTPYDAIAICTCTWVPLPEPQQVWRTIPSVTSNRAPV